MTAPDVRATHLAQQAAITVDALTSHLTGDADTLDVWPHNMWGGAGTVTFATTPAELDPDDYLDLPVHMDGDLLP